MEGSTLMLCHCPGAVQADLEQRERAHSFRNQQEGRKVGRRAARRVDVIVDPKQLRKASDVRRKRSPADGQVVRRGDMVHTETGYGRTLFENDRFVVRHQVLAPGSSIGFGLHPSSDRFVYVASGRVYVVTERAGQREVNNVSAGHDFIAKACDKHGYGAHSDSDAVLIVTEAPNYEAGWIAIEAATDVAGPQRIEQRPARRAGNKAVQQQLAAAADNPHYERIQPQLMPTMVGNMAPSGGGQVIQGPQPTTLSPELMAELSDAMPDPVIQPR